MRFSTELLIVIGAMVIFYFRIAQLRGRKKRYERDYALKRRKVNGRSKGMAMPQKPAGSPPYLVKSWLLVALSILIMIFGILLYNNMTVLGVEIIKDEAFLATYAKYWYIPVSLGVILLAFCITIEKPIFDNKEENEDAK